MSNERNDISLSKVIKPKCARRLTFTSIAPGGGKLKVQPSEVLAEADVPERPADKWCSGLGLGEHFELKGLMTLVI